MRARTNPQGELWAITSYFNPLPSRQRLTNYRTFRRALSVPLVTVELSSAKEFQLQADDADILIQLHSPTVLWHKERLLNVALQAVPRECHKIAWLDCDVVFADDDWRARASRSLDRFAVVQLFRELYDLPRGAMPEEAGASGVHAVRFSLIDRLAAGAAGPEVFRTCGASLTAGYSAGHAWAARREVLDRHGLYDARILGSGNKVMLSAAYGNMDDSIHAYMMNRREAEHYLAWAMPYFSTVRSSLACVDGRVFHLWHGDLNGRNYANRYTRFKEFEFDPFEDIALDGNGCWRWNSDKTAMHEYVRRYFESRREDG